MDEFFQRLREIQKKERNNSGLADVGDNFYKDVNNYLKRIIIKIDNNPFSFESYLLRDARRIASEICERREHKITNSALLNIQRSRRLFNEKSENQKSNTPSIPPANLTSEEEDLYFLLTKSLLKYRKEMVPPLGSLKSKVDKSALETEVTSKKQIKSEFSRNLNSKEKKSAPMGIEQDIASYQAYEQPEHEEPGDIPLTTEDALKIADDPKEEIKTLMVLEDIPSIMGVDKEIYGPLSPQDIITMPEPNAQIIINNKKGRFIEKYKKIAYK
ncbi:MAG: hypothetical protein HZC47_01490 [Methanobacterium sp.]|uniref:DNA replication complex subunit Gins51 n=1 Tax=Methanobacterium sp. TaxID=2164 RepID=UPI003D64C800|nr:hypothetical protein [Methanobacterium sp.]